MDTRNADDLYTYIKFQSGPYTADQKNMIDVPHFKGMLEDICANGSPKEALDTARAILSLSEDLRQHRTLTGWLDVDPHLLVESENARIQRDVETLERFRFMIRQFWPVGSDRYRDWESKLFEVESRLNETSEEYTKAKSGVITAIDLKRAGKRGKAANSPESAWRGLLAIKLDGIIPSYVCNRYAFIAALLTAAGLKCTRQNVTSILNHPSRGESRNAGTPRNS